MELLNNLIVQIVAGVIVAAVGFYLITHPRHGLRLLVTLRERRHPCVLYIFVVLAFVWLARLEMRYGNIVPLPDDAVVAFATTCPKSGWASYSKAEGRFILGVGKGPLTRDVGLEIHGGREFVNYESKPFRHADDSGHTALSIDDEQSDSGGTNSNMPPYIALYFCKKTG